MWGIQPLFAVERMAERVPGRWPLSSPCRRRRWPEGRALQGPSVPGYNRLQRTDGLRFKTSRSREASCRGAQSPIRNSIEPKFVGLIYTSWIENCVILGMSLANMSKYFASGDVV